MNKTIPYEDTFLTFYNYKEPLRKVDKGFGYEGVLLGTTDGEQVQCHMCGKLFAMLGPHVKVAHPEIRGLQKYKEKFGLAHTTALVSEAERERRKVKQILYYHNMSSAERKKKIQANRDGYAKWLKANRSKLKDVRWKIRLETKNKRGTCPDQLLEKIIEVSKALGKTPSKQEFIEHFGSQRYYHLIKVTFGTWKAAVEKAGLEERKHVQHTGKKRHYSDDELLDYLSNFYRETGKAPSYTDCRRELIPHEDIYIRRFGSLPKARKLAGIEENPTRWTKAKQLA